MQVGMLAARTRHGLETPADKHFHGFLARIDLSIGRVKTDAIAPRRRMLVMRLTILRLHFLAWLQEIHSSSTDTNQMQMSAFITGFNLTEYLLGPMEPFENKHSAIITE